MRKGVEIKVIKWKVFDKKNGKKKYLIEND